jgi:hypothetical protein
METTQLLSRDYFNAVCGVNGIDSRQGRKIIDGRYKPYLSALDDQYYQGNDVWDAKTNALTAAIKSLGVEKVKEKISLL